MTNEQSYWNKDALCYDKRAEKSHKGYQTIIRLIKNELSSQMSILDIGTGTGEIPISIYENVKSIDAIDFSSEMIRLAQNKIDAKGIKNIKFIVQDGNHIDKADSSYDAILISNLLHIVPEPKDILLEAKRLIKKDGKIIISTYLHNENFKSKLISWLLKRKGHPIYTRFDSESLPRFIEACTLKITSKVLVKNIMPLLYIAVVK
jgi:phosphatidylethanolamine/phosphatidyl-N-methylethanolamine N-methyltransferase